MWYLTFYCNPRLKEAVVNKILMDGFHATAALYGKYVEKYLHSEEVTEAEEIAPQEINKSGMASNIHNNRISIQSLYFLFWINILLLVGGYNVSSIFSVIMYNILYILICPFIALKEFGIVLKNSMNRDLGGRRKTDPKVFEKNPVILVKD